MQNIKLAQTDYYRKLWFQMALDLDGCWGQFELSKLNVINVKTNRILKFVSSDFLWINF
jgi:hypothetical protein